MTLFFVRDTKHRYRLFEADPSGSPAVRFSRARRALELAKEKLMLLPQRILRREQAFANASKLAEGPVILVHSGGLDEGPFRRKFRLFLHKQRSSHFLFLAAETLLLPFAALSGFLPGPNVAFYSLALLMILQWRAQRGIRKLFLLPWEVRTSSVLEDWELAVEAGRREDILTALGRIESELRVVKAGKILDRTGSRRPGRA